jgi:hypothetical protein
MYGDLPQHLWVGTSTMLHSLMISPNFLGFILYATSPKFFQCFRDFQNLVERQFERKIKSV